MKENTVNEAIEMIDKFLSLVTIDLEDDLDRQLVAAYIFGMLNGQAHEESKSPRSGYLEYAQLPSRGTWDSSSDTGQPDE